MSAGKSGTTQKEKGERFRALHARGTFVIPNPYDAGTARILAGIGFEALATSSAGFAFTIGRRDGGITREEALDHARAVVEACDLPVSADLENCFGHPPETVAETIRLAAKTGLVGCSVEDFSGDERRPIYEFEHAVERVAAAVEAARSLPFPFTLTARTENFLHGRRDLDDTVRRLKVFADAGADVLYAPGLPDLEAVKAVCAAVAPKPVNVMANGRVASFTVASLGAAGVRRISVGPAFAAAALGGFLRAAREVKEKGTFTFGPEAPASAEIAVFMLGKDGG